MSDTILIGRCPKCHKELRGTPLECPFCGIIIAKFIELQEKRLSGEIPPVDSTRPAVTPLSIFEWIVENKMIVLILLLTGFWGFGKIKNALFPLDLSDFKLATAEANTQTTDPCLNKQRCLIVLVAPWCPVCHSARPQIMSLRDSWRDSKRFGLKIIVSADKMNALQDEARQLGDNTYVDPENRFVHATGFNAFPTWVVLDSDSKVLTHFSGVFDGDPDIARYTLLNKLHLVRF